MTEPVYNIEEATSYLETGGLGEVIGLTSAAMQMRQPKVQMDTDMAMALCLMADEALKLRAGLMQRLRSGKPAPTTPPTGDQSL